jgi:arsenate reductase
MPITIYGIKNCDTMKKARTWLEQRDVTYTFHDYKVAGIDADRLQRWAAKAGWETLLNRSGTTFRKLGDAQKSNLDERKALKLMAEQPSLIKRPVLEMGNALLIGFKPDVYQAVVRGKRD